MSAHKSLRYLWDHIARRFGHRASRRPRTRYAGCRDLRLEALESRELMSISTIAQSWKTLSGTLTGTYSGTVTLPNTGTTYYTDSFQNAHFQETVNLVYANNLETSSGTTVSTDAAHNYGSGTNWSLFGPPNGPSTTGAYTFTFSGNGTISENNGQFQRTPGTSPTSDVIVRTPSASIGGGCPYDLAMSGTDAPVSGQPSAIAMGGSWNTTVPSGSYTAQTSGSYQGTLVQSGTFDMAVTAASWNSDGTVQFTIQSTGPCVPVANRATAITSVNLYWADAQGNRLASALPGGDTVGIYWNQASGTYEETGISDKNVYQGATQLIITVNEGNNISGFTEANMANNVFSLPITPAPSSHATIGLYDPATSTFYLRNINTSGAANIVVGFGAPGANWTPLAGDWNGTGQTTVGLYDPSTSLFYLRNSNTSGAADTTFGFGDPSLGSQYVPLVGDWTGQGHDTIGLYDRQTAQWFLRDSNSTGVANISFAFGAPGSDWVPLVGKWSGSGVDTIGLYDPQHAIYYLRNSNSTGVANETFAYGQPGSAWTPLAGDWTGAGTTTIGLYDPAAAQFYLRDSDTTGVSDLGFGFGQAGSAWQPIVGNWVGTGVSSTTSSAAPGLALTAAAGAGAPAGAGNPSPAISPQAVDAIDPSAVAAGELQSVASLDDISASAARVGTSL